VVAAVGGCGGGAAMNCSRCESSISGTNSAAAAAVVSSSIDF
jgi:hypothetical protein